MEILWGRNVSNGFCHICQGNCWFSISARGKWLSRMDLYLHVKLGFPLQVPFFGKKRLIAGSPFKGSRLIFGSTAGTWSLWGVVESQFDLQPPLLACPLCMIGSIETKHSPMALGEAWPASGILISSPENVIRVLHLGVTGQGLLITIGLMGIRCDPSVLPQLA